MELMYGMLFRFPVAPSSPVGHEEGGNAVEPQKRRFYRWAFRGSWLLLRAPCAWFGTAAHRLYW